MVWVCANVQEVTAIGSNTKGGVLDNSSNINTVGEQPDKFLILDTTFCEVAPAVQWERWVIVDRVEEIRCKLHCARKMNGNFYPCTLSMVLKRTRIISTLTRKTALSRIVPSIDIFVRETKTRNPAATIRAVLTAELKWCVSIQRIYLYSVYKLLRLN